MGIESPVHLAFVLVVALLVLGPKRLPGVARALGQGIREFRQSLDLGASGEAQPPSPAASETSAPHASSATPSPVPPRHPGDSTPVPAVPAQAADATPVTPPQPRG